MNIGDLVVSVGHPRTRDTGAEFGMIIGKVQANEGAWGCYPHAAEIAAGGPFLYYVIFNTGRFSGPVFGDGLVLAGRPGTIDKVDNDC